MRLAFLLPKYPPLLVMDFHQNRARRYVKDIHGYATRDLEIEDKGEWDDESRALLETFRQKGTL